MSSGIIASLGLPLVSTVLPGRTSNLTPLGSLVASAAIIGVVVSASESILALISASNAFCALYAFSETPLPQNLLGTKSCW